MGKLRVLTLNIWNRQGPWEQRLPLIRAGIRALDPDLVGLQEIIHRDGRSQAEDIAQGLGYEAAFGVAHDLGGGVQFGNAVLSRWPIAGDARLVLPHPSRYAGTHRIATAATVRICGLRVRAYATHLGTAADITQGQRRAQLAAIVRDAAAYDHVVIGGDLNSGDLGDVATRAGYGWPTREGPRTTRFGRWDHLFLKGLASTASGTVADNRHASDHLPVWAVASLPLPPGAGCRR